MTTIHTRQLQQYTRPTNNIYTQDNLKLATVVVVVVSDIFPIKSALKQGEALSPLLFSFVLEHTFGRISVKQDGL